MDGMTIFKQFGARNNGDIYLGVVGPVRVGKSTFIKRFMEMAVLPYIEDEEEKNRTRDELPTSGSGKTITTVEPKFVPANGVSLKVEENLSVRVRLIDCVGFIIESASGYLEDGKMRMVKTPWFSEDIPFDDAAKIGTQKVIKEHSTLGIVIFNDGSIGEFNRDDYLVAESKIIEEMQIIGRPYVIILNSKNPNEEATKELSKDLFLQYNVPVIPLNIAQMSQEECLNILKEALYQYPLTSIDVALPSWVASLDDTHELRVSINKSIEVAMTEAKIVKDVNKIVDIIKENENVSDTFIKDVDTSTGIVTVEIQVKEELYEQVLTSLVGCSITSKGDLIKVLSRLLKAEKEYTKIANALLTAKETGYGCSEACLEEIKIDKPCVMKAGNRYGIKVKATTSTYHVIKVDLETSFEPILGSKIQSDYFVDYLSKAYEENPLLVLDCEMFGQKFKEIIKAGINSKLITLPEPIKAKMCQLLKTITNKGKSNLVAVVF